MLEDEFPELAIELVTSYHDRKSFRCGESSMDDFFAEKGAAEAYGTTRVLVPSPRASQVLAYYTLCPDVLDYDDGGLGVIELERLAVAQEHQRKGIGRFVLLTVIADVLDVADAHGIEALGLLALNEAARQWYLRLELGLVPLPGVPGRLVLPVSRMRHVL